MSRESLLPCPFCGGERLKFEPSHVRCRSCCADGPVMDDIPEGSEADDTGRIWNEAIATLWNTRHTPPVSEVTAWVGRKVIIDDGPDEGRAVVLAVDDTAYAPSAWVKLVDVTRAREYPRYRSVDLSDLVDAETQEGGPRWGTLGPEVAATNPGATPAALSPEQ